MNRALRSRRRTRHQDDPPLPHDHRTLRRRNLGIVWDGCRRLWLVAFLAVCQHIPTFVEWATFLMDSFAVIDALLGSIFS